MTRTDGKKLMNFETLTYSLDDHVATITLSRPEKLNAFNTRMMAELVELLDHTDRDDAVRAIILTGEGRAFCSGADLSGGAKSFEFSRRGEPEREATKVNGIYRDGGGRVTMRLFDSLKPVIAAINGPAIGAGATIPLAADIRIASTTARFGFVFSRRGIVPEAASSWFLTRHVGVQTALAWCLSGKTVDADEALARNLVYALHEPQDLLVAAQEMAHQIAHLTAPLSAALTRQLFWRLATADHPMEAHRADSRAIQALGGTSDAHEALASFLEKRAPLFTASVTTDMPEIWPEWTAPPFR
ncbi:crotonase/enoyl-CoA hydratase family protein [Sphingopyxis fribergensis]